MKSARTILVAWCVLAACVVAGDARAGTHCVNGVCYACDGTLSCTSGVCTCNGEPAQRVPAPEGSSDNTAVAGACREACAKTLNDCLTGAQRGNDVSQMGPMMAVCAKQNTDCMQRCSN